MPRLANIGNITAPIALCLTPDVSENGPESVQQLSNEIRCPQYRGFARTTTLAFSNG